VIEVRGCVGQVADSAWPAYVGHVYCSVDLTLPPLSEYGTIHKISGSLSKGLFTRVSFDMRAKGEDPSDWPFCAISAL